MKSRIILLFAGLISLNSACSSMKLTESASKNEFERPISQSEFPQEALDILFNALPQVKDYKYYQESDGLVLSYEAKVKVDGKDLSIEFDTSGILLDVEILTDFNAIPPPANNSIIEYFESNYKSYRVTRVQYQYSSSTLQAPEIIKQALNSNISGIQLRIEMEIEGKRKRQMGFFEYLFDRDGKLIKSRRIQKRSLDNIW